MSRFISHTGPAPVVRASTPGFWLRFGLALMLAFGLAAGLGCGGKTSATDEPSTRVPPDEDTRPAVSEKGKKWEGWRWQGARDACYFVFKNECFETEEAACKAAECGEGACRVEAGAPTLVSCKQ